MFARMVIPAAPHHITYRNNNQQDAFFVKKDDRISDYPKLKTLG